jgi:pyrimidine deaminase RibD-like protein
MKNEIIKYVFAEAAKSNIEKRKVGCIIVDDATQVIIGKGYNTDGIHAEVAAISDASNKVSDNPTSVTVYVSQPPCPNCAEELIKAFAPAKVNIEVVEEFMKFDGDKVRYDLVPPSAIKAMADVLTFGARKYKPNNWQNCKEPERYLAAMYRHLEAWRQGEINDQDSGMSHLAHAMTNLAFMLELGYNPTNWVDKDGE